MSKQVYYRARPRGRHQRAGRGRVRWGLIPLTALLIFLAAQVLTRTGLAGQLEAAVTAAAQNESLAQGLMRLVLPEGHSAGDAPAPEALVQAEPPEPGGGVQQDEPVRSFWQETVPPEEDESNHEGAAMSDEELRMLLPDPLVFESVLPQWEGDGTAAPAPVSSLTISGRESGYEGSGTVYMRNETDYAIDPQALMQKASPVKLSGDGVQVLVMHTHGTEAYTADSTHDYDASDPYRTTDSSRNVLRVGEEITAILEERGIKTLHATTLNDYPAYSGSYSRALEDITRYIKEHPSIKMVIDVHRDAMISQNGTVYKTVADIDGKQAAQLMFVTGTDQGGLSHDGWRDNLTFQLKLHDRMNTRYPGIMRPINIRSGRFNQHVTAGSMLLEVGTTGNSLSEALYSARLFAQELADMLNGK